MRANCSNTTKAAARLRRAAVLIVLAALPGLAHAVDFKGIELGEPLWFHHERDVFGELDCNPLRLGKDDYQAYMLEMQALVPGAQQVCVATTSIATAPADATVILGMSRRVLRLTFQFTGDNYPLVLSAMGEKWGEGVHEVRGEKNESTWWDFSDGSSISVHLSPVENAQNDAIASVGLVEYMLPTTASADDL